MSPALRDALKEFVSPLAVTAYAGWAAVFYQSGSQLAEAGPGIGLAARTLMLLYLAGTLLTMVCDGRSWRVREAAGYLLMLACALGLLWLGRSETAPILLVILAAALGERLPDRALIPIVALLIGAFFAMLLWRWQFHWRSAATYALTFGSFIAFAAMALRHAARSKAMSERLQEVNAHLHATRSLLSETARDSERLHLARELHDVAGHKLTALKLNLRGLGRDPTLTERPELGIATRLADELLEDLRAVVRQLRAHDGIELAAAFQRLAEPLPRPQVRIEVGSGARVPLAAQAEALLRVAQEGLTNAARHGEARQARLSLQREADSLVLRLEDDGRVRWPLREGNGLNGMRERLAALGGRLELRPSALGGLQLLARLPLEMPT